MITYPEETLEQELTRKAYQSGVSPETLFNILEEENKTLDINASNPYSSASGLFQFTNATWEDCQKRFGIIGEKNEKDNQIACAIEFIKAGERWRWSPYNCWIFAKTLIKHLPNTKDLVPNVDYPHVDGVVIMDYDGTPHYAVILAVLSDGIKIVETNYEAGKKTYRTLNWGDKAIVGYWYKELPKGG